MPESCNREAERDLAFHESIRRSLTTDRLHAIRREELARTRFEERELLWRLKEQESLLDVAARVFGRSRRPSCCLAVLPRGSEHGRRRLFNPRMMLLAAQTE